MLEPGQAYYCKTERDVDLIMSLLEKESYRWCSGASPRSCYQKSPIVYYMENGKSFHCSYPPHKMDINTSIHVNNICNKIISELRR